MSKQYKKHKKKYIHGPQNKVETKVENVVLMSFNAEEDSQSLRRLNNKQKSSDIANQQVIKINNLYNKTITFQESIVMGFFNTEKKHNFDISIIISNDSTNWFLLNLTFNEIDWLANNIGLEITRIFVNKDFNYYNNLLVHLVQNNIELLLTFKNSTKNYEKIKFNYLWLGITDIMIDEPTFDDWILHYT